MQKKTKEATWYEKYHLALKENLTIKEIMKLRSCGQSTAIELREEAIKYCLGNDIPLLTKQVPTDVIMLVTGRNLSFYHEKMVKELEAKELYNKTHNPKESKEDNDNASI